MLFLVLEGVASSHLFEADPTQTDQIKSQTEPTPCGSTQGGKLFGSLTKSHLGHVGLTPARYRRGALESRKLLDRLVFLKISFLEVHPCLHILVLMARRRV